MTKEQISLSHCIAYISMVVLLVLPHHAYVDNRDLEIFGGRPFITLALLSATGGFISGFLFPKYLKGRILGGICGVVSGLGASLLFSYYLTFFPGRDSFIKWEIFLVYIVGIAPGLVAYALIEKTVFNNGEDT